MAMTLRLTDEETAALRKRAEFENRSKQEVARTAINTYISERSVRLMQAIALVAEQDAELLRRLSQ